MNFWRCRLGKNMKGSQLINSAWFLHSCFTIPPSPIYPFPCDQDPWTLFSRKWKFEWSFMVRLPRDVNNRSIVGGCGCAIFVEYLFVISIYHDLTRGSENEIILLIRIIFGGTLIVIYSSNVLHRSDISASIPRSNNYEMSGDSYLRLKAIHLNFNGLKKAITLFISGASAH